MDEVAALREMGRRMDRQTGPVVLVSMDSSSESMSWRLSMAVCAAFLERHDRYGRLYRKGEAGPDRYTSHRMATMGGAMIGFIDSETGDPNLLGFAGL